MSPSTISRKNRKLEESGLIKGYVAIIEDERLGYGCRAILLVRVGGNIGLTTVVGSITSMKQICSATAS